MAEGTLEVGSRHVLEGQCEPGDVLAPVGQLGSEGAVVALVFSNLPDEVVQLFGEVRVELPDTVQAAQ